MYTATGDLQSQCMATEHYKSVVQGVQVTHTKGWPVCWQSFAISSADLMWPLGSFIAVEPSSLTAAVFEGLTDIVHCIPSSQLASSSLDCICSCKHFEPWLSAGLARSQT